LEKGVKVENSNYSSSESGNNGLKIPNHIVSEEDEDDPNKLEKSSSEDKSLDKDEEYRPRGISSKNI